MRWFAGHLGPVVTPLLDGELEQAESERAWEHVLTCGECQSAVEREAWVKSRVAFLAPGEPPSSLVGSLSGLAADDWQDEEAVRAAWTTVDAIEARHRARRAGVAAVGAGGVSAAILGFAAFGGLLGGSTPVGAPAASLTGGSTPGAAALDMETRLRAPRP
jgi:hypothetical protein